MPAGVRRIGKVPTSDSLLVLDDRAAAEISQELVAPAGAENGAPVIDQALNDLPQRCGEGMFPGDRKRPGSADQDGVSVFNVAPADIGIVDEVDEVELAPGDTAALDEAALLLFEGYELVPDLEEDESKSGSWCRHFILRAFSLGDCSRTLDRLQSQPCQPSFHPRMTAKTSIAVGRSRPALAFGGGDHR